MECGDADSSWFPDPPEAPFEYRMNSQQVEPARISRAPLRLPFHQAGSGKYERTGAVVTPKADQREKTGAGSIESVSGPHAKALQNDGKRAEAGECRLNRLRPTKAVNKSQFWLWI
jgi:hypothetical protein